jgi:hypothetical protein
MRSTPCSQARSAETLPAEVWAAQVEPRSGVVRGCPLVAGQHCCEWHASGTAGEDHLAHRGVVAPTSTAG